MTSATNRTLTTVAMLSWTFVCWGCQPTADEAPQPVPEELGSVSHNLLTTAPELGCTGLTFGGKSYFFCAFPHSWSVSRQLCKNVGADLITIDSEAENTFAYQNTGIWAWTSANDLAVEGTWRWASTDTAFWQGTNSGSAIGGRYSKWYWNQPDPLATTTKDCASTDITGQWAAQDCSASLPYICEEFTSGDCNEAVLGKARAGKPAGAEILSPLVQADLLRCATPELTSCQAAFHGAVRFDTYLASKQAIAGTITPSRMLAVKMDRARKLNVLARTNSGWINAYCAGDTDSDLVPNSLDQCAGTPALTPTTDTGCTSSTTVAGPTPAVFQKAMGALGLIRDRDCANTPLPTTPVNVRSNGYAVTWTDTLPAGACERWYEFKIFVLRANGSTVTDHFAVRRRDSDADVSPLFGPRTTLCVDALAGSLSGPCKNLIYPSTQGGFAPAPWPWANLGSGDTMSVQMRAFDGNGNHSSWAYFTRTFTP